MRKYHRHEVTAVVAGMLSVSSGTASSWPLSRRDCDVLLLRCRGRFHRPDI